MTANLDKIIEDLSCLSALEVANLAKMLEEKWGVKAAVAVAGLSSAGTAATEEKDSFNVILETAGDSKINVIKEIRTITGLGLKEAKDLVDGAPKSVKEGIKKDEAESIKAKLEAVGAKVKLS